MLTGKDTARVLFGSLPALIQDRIRSSMRKLKIKRFNPGKWENWEENTLIQENEKIEKKKTH